MPPKVNLIGQKFGRLTILEEANKRNEFGNVMWVCLCECGNTKTISSNSLRSNLTTSCGCYSRETVIKFHTKHGQCPRKGKSLTYLSWDGMIQRCTNSNHKQYYSYSKIKIDPRWMFFDNFVKDMGERPSKGHTLDRFPDQNGDYELSNCRWATWVEQSRNKKSNIWIEYNNKRMILTDWAKELGTKLSVIRRSMKRGKTFEEVYNYYKDK